MEKRQTFQYFGERARAVRRRQGLTQQELAELADVNYTAICRMERRTSNKIFLHFAMPIAQALGRSLDELAHGRPCPGCGVDLVAEYPGITYCSVECQAKQIIEGAENEHAASQ